MIKMKFNRHLSAYAILVILGGMTLIYQGCGVDGFQATDMASSSDTSFSSGDEGRSLFIEKIVVAPAGGN